MLILVFVPILLRIAVDAAGIDDVDIYVDIDVGVCC